MRNRFAPLLALLVYPLLTLADAKDDSIKAEISRLLKKTPQKGVVIDKLEYSRTWECYYFEATDPESKTRYTGHIYVTVSEKDGKYQAKIDYRPYWLIPNPMYVFSMQDENGHTVASRTCEIRVKGKRFRF